MLSSVKKSASRMPAWHLSRRGVGHVIRPSNAWRFSNCGLLVVGRMLQEPHKTIDSSSAKSCDESATGCIVTAKRPNHVWHIDLTIVPTGAGLWCFWLPLALPQQWPFCYWVAVAVDHFSRRAMGVGTFKQQPTSLAVRSFLGRTMARTTPRYIVCDRGVQFDCQDFRKWCRRKGIKKPRYGAVGKKGSIAVVERFILTLKTILGCLLLVPYRRDKFREELLAAVEWYNKFRAHSWLGGRTPDEVYYRKFPANRKPRHEPRAAWPRGSPCARPWALVRGKPGAELVMEVSFHRGRKHLPIVNLKRAAWVVRSKPFGSMSLPVRDWSADETLILPSCQGSVSHRLDDLIIFSILAS